MIQELQFKKKKLDYISYLADLIKGDTKAIDFEEVKKEIDAKIEPMLIELMNCIENDLPVTTTKTLKGEFSEQELNALKTVATRLTSQAANSGQFSNESAPKPARPSKGSQQPAQDKMSFAMSNRHLANKKVTVLNQSDNSPLGQGIVVGLDAPHVVVKMDAGQTINVPLEKISL